VSLFRTLSNDYERAAGKVFTITGFASYYFRKLGFRAAVWYRIANCLHGTRLTALSTVIMVRTWSKTGAEISPGATIGPGFVLAHPVGVVIGHRAVIGSNCTILQGVTIGENYPKDPEHRYPVIGDQVTICAGAKILGDITIGSNTIVGANAVVKDSMPMDSVVVGVPARAVRTSGMSAC